jgi:hypothetical protein
MFGIALGEVDPDEAGSASGASSAVQQLVAGIGSAAVTSVHFAALASGGVQHAMILLWVVIGIVVLCTAIVPLLPKKAAAEEQP